MTWFFVRVAIAKGTSDSSPEIVSGFSRLDRPQGLRKAVEEAVLVLQANATADHIHNLDAALTETTLTPASVPAVDSGPDMSGGAPEGNDGDAGTEEVRLDLERSQEARRWLRGERDRLREELKEAQRALWNIAYNVPAMWGGEYVPKQIQQYAREALGRAGHPIGTVVDGALRWTDAQGVEHSGPYPFVGTGGYYTESRP